MRPLVATNIVVLLASSLVAQTTTRVSLDSSGTQGNEDSVRADLSDDGQTVVFHSAASNLVAGDTNAMTDVFVHQQDTGITERISISTSGAEADMGSYGASLDSSGLLVAFTSASSNLVAGDTNGVDDIYVRDRFAGTTERVSIDSSGNEGNGQSSWGRLSLDGRYVAFQSSADNLVAGDANESQDIFRHDRLTGATIRLSVSTTGTEGDDNSYLPAISRTGRYVAYHSYATTLVPGDTNDEADVFLTDADTGATYRVSVDSAGNQGNGYSITPSISADGGRVVFGSRASNLVSGDTNGQVDVFLHDLTTGETIRISVDSSGGEGDFTSSLPDIAPSGEVIAFTSFATNLVSGDTNGQLDVFIHDLTESTTFRASVDTSGGQGNSASRYGVLSSNGSVLAFQSTASNLVTDDTNAQTDVFVRADISLGFPLQPASGDAVSFVVDHAPQYAGKLAFVLMSCSGTQGFKLGGIHVPLTFDPCTVLSLQAGSLLRGAIDAKGTARTPTFPFPEVPVGTTFHAAAVILGPSGFCDATAPITVTTR